jgi:hypothetical protein
VLEIEEGYNKTMDYLCRLDWWYFVVFVAIFMPVVSGTTVIPSTNKTTIMIVNDIVKGEIRIPQLLG